MVILSASCYMGLILLKDVVTYQAHRAGFCLLCFFHNQDLDRFEIQTKISGWKNRLE